MNGRAGLIECVKRRVTRRANDDNTSGRVAVVTGASGGIGASLAAMLAGEGASVVLAARRETALERIANDIRRSGCIASSMVTDLAQDDSLANLVTQTRAELGQIDILVNNAGYVVGRLGRRIASKTLVEGASRT